jgi:hypothetical protein
MSAANAPLLSAIAALFAGAVALVIGLLNSVAAMRSSKAALKAANSAGRHRIAESRQRWIDSVIATLAEHQAVELTLHSGAKNRAADERTLAGLRTRLEILLNPDEQDTVDLLNAMDELHRASDESTRAACDQELISVARRLLKREWERIKTELTQATPD